MAGVVNLVVWWTSPLALASLLACHSNVLEGLLCSGGKALLPYEYVVWVAGWMLLACVGLLWSWDGVECFYIQ